jgi:hypothetical protein
MRMHPFFAILLATAATLAFQATPALANWT